MSVTHQNSVDLATRNNVTQRENVSSSPTLVPYPDGSPSLENPYYKMSALTFAVGMLNGMLQPSPRVNLPAVPVPILHEMIRTNLWPSDFMKYLS